MHGGAQRTDQTKVYTKLVTIRSTLVVMTLIGMTSFFLMTASCKQPSSWQCMSPPDMLEQSFSDKVLGKSSQPWQQGFAVYAHITETTLSHQDIKMSYSLRVYNGKALLSLWLFAWHICAHQHPSVRGQRYDDGDGTTTEKRKNRKDEALAHNWFLIDNVRKCERLNMCDAWIFD